MRKTYHRFTGKQLVTTAVFTLTMFPLFAQLFQACPPGTPGFEECEDITCTVCDLNGFTGSTAGYGLDPDNDLQPYFCGIIQSVQYIKFFAAAAQMNIKVTTSNCSVNTGIDLGIMTGCDQIPLVACKPGNGTNSTVISLNGLTIGHFYILIIDVDATSDCDFVITVDPPDATIPFIPSNYNLQGDFTVCPGSINTYEVTPVTLIGNYTWTLPPGTVIDYIPGNGSTVNINWGDISGDLCVTVTNPCTFQSSTVCHAVTITPIPPTILPPVKVCVEDAPYVLPWGENIYASGTFQYALAAYTGCDSLLVQQVTILPAKTKTLNPVTLCEGDCMTVCGQTYCDYGAYSVICQSVEGCDSAVNFSIVAPNLVAEILGSGSISCITPTITLQSALSSGTKTWYDASGQQVGTGPTFTVNSPGTYFLTVTLLLGGSACSKSDSIVIPLNIGTPDVTATGVMIGCDTLPALLHAVSMTNPAQYTWSGPNGFSSNLQNPPVLETGTYFVTIVNPANGCSSKDTAYVTPCCHLFAGTVDTALLRICGEKSLLANFHGDQMLEAGDSLVFILYSNPADPLGSMLMILETPLFPFVTGLTQMDVTYYAASLAGPVLPDSTIDLTSPCLSVSPGEPMKWVPKPGITVSSPPAAICKGECLNITFQFSGVPPFQFHYNIFQNGQLLYTQDENAAALQKTITVCPSAFLQAPGPQPLQFNVNFLQDTRCSCND